jgi:hypothetical protein
MFLVGAVVVLETAGAVWVWRARKLAKEEGGRSRMEDGEEYTRLGMEHEESDGESDGRSNRTERR